MLIAGSRFLNAPVMGLQTGGELARTSREIIDPATLEIIAFELEGPLLTEHPSLLRIADVREFSDMGIIVDSSEEFVSLDDVIKLKDIYDLGFELIGKQVIDEKKEKLGKVIAYTIDTVGFMVQQLSIKRPLLKSFNDTELLVHRSQIVEVNDEAIIVKSDAATASEPTATPLPSYRNPFRSSSPQPNNSDLGQS
jgi:uncharacterized protein YrrD